MFNGVDGGGRNLTRKLADCTLQIWCRLRRRPLQTSNQTPQHGGFLWCQAGIGILLALCRNGDGLHLVEIAGLLQ